MSQFQLGMKSDSALVQYVVHSGKANEQEAVSKRLFSLGESCFPTEWFNFGASNCLQTEQFATHVNSPLLRPGA